MTIQTVLKLDKYPEAYKQVPDFQTWIEEHVTTDNKKLYVVTGSLYFISQVQKMGFRAGKCCLRLEG
ncbi:MAG: hypothetical protein ACLU4Q_07195 [Streptococcus thermophilus]